MFEDIELTGRYSSPPLSFPHWSNINWKKVKKTVLRLQKRIHQAAMNQEWKKVKNLQKLLVLSYYNRLSAIKRVTNQNRGKNTPGIDKMIYQTSGDRWRLVSERFDFRTHHPWPVKRIYILKKNGGNRYIDIPTIKDRVMQTIVKAALEPEWEAKFEPNSYGFRPKRSHLDAAKQVWNLLHKPESNPWILKADIYSCFENIAHTPLIQKIHRFKSIIKRWLKTGVIKSGQYFQMRKGIPQGSSISPLLANIILDGMERLFIPEFEKDSDIPPNEKNNVNERINLIRYADDFVVLARTKTILLTYCIPKLETFLQIQGLKLNQKKTRIVHRTEGFTFLGFSFKYIKLNRRYKLLCKSQKEKYPIHFKQSERCKEGFL